MSDRKLSDVIVQIRCAVSARSGEEAIMHAEAAEALVTSLEAEVERLRVNDARYQALRDRHFLNCPGDSAALWNGSQYEHCADDLDALADYARARARGCNVDELPERVAADKENADHE